MKKNFYPRLFEFERQSNPYTAMGIGILEEIKKFIKEFDVDERRIKLDYNGNSEIEYNKWISDLPSQDISNIETAYLIGPLNISFNLVKVIINSIGSYHKGDISKFRSLYETKNDNFRFNFILPSEKVFFEYVFDGFIDNHNKKNVRIPNDIMNRMLEIFNKKPSNYIDYKIFSGLNIDINIQKDLLRDNPNKLMGENWGEYDYLGKNFTRQVLNDFFDKDPFIRKGWIVAYNNYNINHFYRDFPEMAVKYMKKFKSDSKLLLTVRENPEFFKKVMGDQNVLKLSERDQEFLEDNRAEAHKILRNAGLDIVSSPTQFKNGNIRVEEQYANYMIYKIGTIKKDGASGYIKHDPLMTYVDMANYLIDYLNK